MKQLPQVLPMDDNPADVGLAREASAGGRHQRQIRAKCCVRKPGNLDGYFLAVPLRSGHYNLPLFSFVLGALGFLDILAPGGSPKLKQPPSSASQGCTTGVLHTLTVYALGSGLCREEGLGSKSEIFAREESDDGVKKAEYGRNATPVYRIFWTFAVNREPGVQVIECERARQELRKTLGEREFLALDPLADRQSAFEELQKTQEALRQSEGRLDAIIHSAMDAIITVDEQERVLIFNAAAERMFGYPAGEVAGSPMERFIPQRFRAAHGAHVRRFSETGASSRTMGMQGGIWGLRANGDEFPLETSISQVEADGKKLFTVILRDISERKRAEEALKESLAASEAVRKDLADQKFAIDQHGIVTVTDVKGRITYVNDKFCAISKYSRDELLGQDHHIISSGYHPKEFFQNLYRTIAQGGVWHGEIRNRAKDGSIYWVDTTIVPFVGADGKPRQYVAIRADITERKHAEARSLQLAAIVESSADAIFSHDLSGTVLSWNKSAERLFGYSEAEAVGNPVMIIPTGIEEEVEEFNRGILEGRRMARDGTTRRCKNGTLLDVSLIMSPLRDSSGRITGASVIARDITKRIRAEQELAVKAEELARSNRELEQFAYVASHDLQEPLRMVASYTQLLAERYCGKLDENADKFIGYAKEGAVRMQVLIHDLLAFSQVGLAGVTRENVDCNAVLEGVVQSLTAAIQETGAVVNYAALPTVWADHPQIAQVFQNLIGNAIKFRKEAPPELAVRAEKSGRSWLFSVSDNGIGIAPEYAENIFVVFQRLHARTEYPGNGIGLAICKKIIEHYDGRIWVESRVGQGSTFKFTLPSAFPREEGGARS
jgi:PAS domain S-box-containing protein